MMDQDQPEKARPLLERAAALFREEPDRPTPASELVPRARGAKRSPLGPRPCPASPQAAFRSKPRRCGTNRVCGTSCPPEALVDLALKETSRAVLIGYGRTDVSEQGKAVRELDLDQAAGNLQLAIRAV